MVRTAALSALLHYLLSLALRNHLMQSLVRAKPISALGNGSGKSPSTSLRASRAHGDLYRGCLEMVSVRFSLQSLAFLVGKAAVCGVL